MRTVIINDTCAVFYFDHGIEVTCTAGPDGRFDPMHPTRSSIRMCMRPLTLDEVKACAEVRARPYQPPREDRPDLQLLELFATFGVPKDEALVELLVDRFSTRSRG